ncbi:hypothetical protein H4582DRAFT_2085376 [Lactarius indigo]|nr:hypothetical protein H4582DRAFT_2085376 [Lactarius indigo]
MAKLNSYYEHSAESDAHIMAMVLDPSMKMFYFRKNWSADLVSKVKDTVKTRSLLHQDISLKVVPCVANEEEAFLNEANQQPANQEGSTTEIVEDTEDWTWEEVAEDHGYGDGDNDDNTNSDDNKIELV